MILSLYPPDTHANSVQTQLWVLTTMRTKRRSQPLQARRCSRIRWSRVPDLSGGRGAGLPTVAAAAHSTPQKWTCVRRNQRRQRCRVLSSAGMSDPVPSTAASMTSQVYCLKGTRKSGSSRCRRPHSAHARRLMLSRLRSPSAARKIRTTRSLCSSCPPQTGQETFSLLLTKNSGLSNECEF